MFTFQIKERINQPIKENALTLFRVNIILRLIQRNSNEKCNS